MEKGFAPKFDGKMDPLNLREVVFAAQKRMAGEPGIEFLPVTYGGVTGEIQSTRDKRK